MFLHRDFSGFLKRTVSALLVWQLTGVYLFAQTPGFLKLTAADGEGAFNDMQRKIGHPPAIRVLDESNNVVQGAVVTFTMPTIGPSVIFTDGSSTGTAMTDDKGMAQCPSYKPNLEEGRFTIRVTATYKGKTGNLVVSQSNTSAGGTAVGQGKKSNMKILLLVLVAGGVVGGVLAATHSGGGTSTPAPTTLSAGGITIGGPK